jgi:hypothetical protein
MEKKKKSCKSNSKAPGIEGCGKLTFKRTFGLCDSCLFEWATTTEPGRIWYQKRFLPKVAKKMKSNQIKKQKAEKDKLIDYSAKLQTKVNEIVRLIDIGLPCLARGYHAGQMHAGHVYARGGNQTIRFNLHNIHRQSAQSNHHQNDDGLMKEGLKREYGQNYLDFVSELRRTPSIELLQHEFKLIYQRACQISLELKKQGKNFNKEERIEKRNEINLDLAIYQSTYCKAF